MRRLIPFLLVVMFSGCASSPVDSEKTREVVLEYLGGSVGTAGPFGKQSKKELAVLSAKDQGEASALLDRGAVAFLVYEPRSSAAVRIILVHKGHVVGDYRAVAKEPART